MPTEVYRIRVGPIDATCEVAEHTVVAGPPVLAWAVGKPLSELRRWARAKKGHLNRQKETPCPPRS